MEFFQQVVNSHKMGAGCQKCGEGMLCSARAIRNKESWCNTESGVYILELKGRDENFLKIGVSKNIDRRIRNIKSESNYNVDIISYLRTELYTAVMIEEELLNDKCNIKYEPKVKFAGHTECIYKYPNSKYLQKDFLKKVYENGY